jgi:hypothetical protein
MSFSQDTRDFNKEFIHSECGALFFAQVFSNSVAFFTQSAFWISSFALIGSFFGGTALWLTSRILHQKRKRMFSKKKLAIDILYLVPVSFLVSLLTYRPISFFLNVFLLETGFGVFFSVLLSYTLGFFVYLGVINLYRLFLAKRYKKIL